ncbi:MAG: hypothetical protein AAF585_21990, partial [Verrucomicrobiota bacterium]
IALALILNKRFKNIPKVAIYIGPLSESDGREVFLALSRTLNTLRGNFTESSAVGFKNGKWDVDEGLESYYQSPSNLLIMQFDADYVYPIPDETSPNGKRAFQNENEYANAEKSSDGEKLFRQSSKENGETPYSFDDYRAFANFYEEVTKQKSGRLVFLIRPDI